MSVQKIGAVLRKAGHEPSRFHASRAVKGWGESSPGYSLRKAASASHIARLSYNGGRLSVPAETMEAKLAEYEALLAAAGFIGQRDRFGRALLVSRGLEGDAGTGPGVRMKEGSNDA